MSFFQITSGSTSAQEFVTPSSGASSSSEAGTSHENIHHFSLNNRISQINPSEFLFSASFVDTDFVATDEGKPKRLEGEDYVAHQVKKTLEQEQISRADIVYDNIEQAIIEGNFELARSLLSTAENDPLLPSEFFGCRILWGLAGSGDSKIVRKILQLHQGETAKNIIIQYHQLQNEARVKRKARGDKFNTFENSLKEMGKFIVQSMLHDREIDFSNVKAFIEICALSSKEIGSILLNEICSRYENKDINGIKSIINSGIAEKETISQSFIQLFNKAIQKNSLENVKEIIELNGEEIKIVYNDIREIIVNHSINGNIEMVKFVCNLGVSKSDIQLILDQLGRAAPISQEITQYLNSLLPPPPSNCVIS